MYLGSLGPNIIYILIDDVGWADFGYNNKIDILANNEAIGEGVIPTPKIDKLAEKGLKLTSHYTHPTCTPSRYRGLKILTVFSVLYEIILSITKFL